MCSEAKARVLRLSLPPDPACFPAARARARSFLDECAVDPRSSAAIVLCLQEALKNAVRYAGTTDDIEIRIAHEGDTISLVVRDHGRGFDSALLDSPPQPRPPDPLAESGRGLYLMRQLMDEVRLASDCGAEVFMVKGLPPT
jgi:serine/threonine-protein kinase RsbW